MTALAPKDFAARMTSSLSVAMRTRDALERTVRSHTHWMIGFPPRFARTLPGKRVLDIRAGMTAIVFNSDIIYSVVFSVFQNYSKIALFEETANGMDGNPGKMQKMFA